MRFVLALLAMVLGLSTTTAQAAALWQLDVSVYSDFVTTTDTYNCAPGSIPDPSQCPATTVAHNYGPFVKSIYVDAFTGSLPFDVQIGSRAWMSGTIDFANGQMLGSNFGYFSEDNNTCRPGGSYGCFIQTTRASAPAFAVNFVAAYGGAGPVPEPGTWAMMLAGFGLVGAGMRRNRAKVTLAL
jgi:hypothetical protein